MLIIKNGNIQLTRGDDAILSLALYTKDGQIYPITTLEEDQMVFNLRKKPMQQPSQPLLKKSFTLFKKGEDSYIPQIHIQSNETKFLQYGTYLWDAQYRMDVDGQSYITTVCSGTFELTAEIG